MNDNELTEVIARKLAKEHGFDADEPMTVGAPPIYISGRSIVSAKYPFPAWQAFVPLASSMIAIARGLDGEASDWLVRGNGWVKAA